MVKILTPDLHWILPGETLDLPVPFLEVIQDGGMLSGDFFRRSQLDIQVPFGLLGRFSLHISVRLDGPAQNDDEFLNQVFEIFALQFGIPKLFKI